MHQASASALLTSPPGLCFPSKKQELGFISLWFPRYFLAFSKQPRWWSCKILTIQELISSELGEFRQREQKTGSKLSLEKFHFPWPLLMLLATFLSHRNVFLFNGIPKFSGPSCLLSTSLPYSVRKRTCLSKWVYFQTWHPHIPLQWNSGMSV